MTPGERVVAFLFGSFFLFVFAQCAVGFRTQARCLELGYPDSSVTLGFTPYCGRMIAQTYYVKPLVEASKQ